MTRLYLLRHGQTDWNVTGRLQGGSDVPLNEVGRAQAQRAAAALAAEIESAPYVVSSDLSRAADTAATVAAAWGIEATLDARLRERSFGAWEGTTSGERDAANPADVALWHAGERPAIAGFETSEELTPRVAAACRDAVAAAAGRDVVLVSHGSALRTLTSALLGLSPADRGIGGLANTAWSILAPSDAGGWTLVRHNVGGD